MFSAVAADICSNWENILRIILSAVCGGLIGFERSLRHKDAGIRTHIILSMGTTIFVLVSRYGFPAAEGLPAGDISRIAANIVTGIGFLGAGVIFVRGGSIKGLTTAAGIWTTAGIGMCIGAGMYTLGIFSAAFMIAIQFLLHKISPSTENMAVSELTLTYPESSGIMDKLQNRMTKMHIDVLSIKIINNPDGYTTALMSVRVSKTEALNDFLSLASLSNEIKEFSISN